MGVRQWVGQRVGAEGRQTGAMASTVHIARRLWCHACSRSSASSGGAINHKPLHFSYPTPHLLQRVLLHSDCIVEVAGGGEVGARIPGGRGEEGAEGAEGGCVSFSLAVPTRRDCFSMF